MNYPLLKSNVPKPPGNTFLEGEQLITAIPSGDKNKVYVLTTLGRCFRVCVLGESFFIELLTQKQPEQHKDRASAAVEQFLSSFTPAPRLQGMPYPEFYDLYKDFCGRAGVDPLPRNTMSWAIRLTFPTYRTTSVKGKRFCNLILKP